MINEQPKNKQFSKPSITKKTQKNCQEDSGE